jgi:hypothetical protein
MRLAMTLVAPLFYKTLQRYEKNAVAASDFGYFFLLFREIVVILQSVFECDTRI